MGKYAAVPIRHLEFRIGRNITTRTQNQRSRNAKERKAKKIYVNVFIHERMPFVYIDSDNSIKSYSVLRTMHINK